MSLSRRFELLGFLSIVLGLLLWVWFGLVYGRFAPIHDFSASAGLWLAAGGFVSFLVGRFLED